MLRLNVGRFHLRTHLAGPPGGEVFERLDTICAFEVVRTNDTVLWGWHPENCAYHEEWVWNIERAEFEERNRMLDGRELGVLEAMQKS
jgi:hypothetical protein